MPELRKKLGDFGESAALAYLVRRGYTEVARKWRCAAGEIDLVMREGATLAFVEVRTRRGQHFGVAEESVGPAKRARLIGLAYAYLAAAELAEDTPWRIDVVAIDVDRTGWIARIDHIRHAIEET
jgi:putative endonuclease